MNWYNFSQNNSGGSFMVNDKVCNELYIEANTFDEAVLKAESLGCYWDGVANGMDCACCGDRWSKWSDDPVDLDKYKTVGYSASIFDGIYQNTVSEWDRRYGKYEVVEAPEFIQEYSVRQYKGRVKINNIEEYAQLISDEYGWTTPDARIYYNDGTVKEIFSNKVR